MSKERSLFMEQPTLTPIEPQTETKTRSRKPALILAGVLAVLLISAAFMAGRLMNKGPAGQSFGGGSGQRIEIKGGPSGGEKSFSIEVIPAKELPQTHPDANGIFTKREDNSIFIGTGNIGVEIVKKGGSEAQPEAKTSYDGPVIEVVITKDTKFYKDVTNQDLSDAPSGSLKLQQKVADGSIDEIGENSSLTVWGKKTGDRVVADVIVYSEPMILMKPLDSTGN
jgi:hypothetical protein